MGAEFVDHYNVLLSPSGNLPATAYGASGLVRDREAYKLYEYYDSVIRNDIDSWILSSDSMLLWSKASGWIDPPTGPWTYQDFLDQTPPFLKIIEIPIDSAFYVNIIYSPWYLRTAVNNYMKALTGYDTEYLPVPVSSDGQLPIEGYIGALTIPETMKNTIHSSFPVFPGNPVRTVLTRADGTEFWNSVDGDVTLGTKITLRILVALLALEIIFD
jgi:hypothetical protein